MIVAARNSGSSRGEAQPQSFALTTPADAKLAKLTRNLAKATPLHRSGLPRDIATAALFLASDEGAYINCHDLVVDGGMIAGGRNNFEAQTPGANV